MFNNGNWSGLQTTGMRGATQSGSELILSSGTLGRLNQTIDLSRYNYIKINSRNEFSGYGEMFIGISTDSNIDATSSSKFVANVTARNSIKGSGYFVAILDVSSISGFYYIYTESGSYNNGMHVHTYPGRINQIYITIS